MSAPEPSVLSGIRPDGTFAYGPLDDRELAERLLRRGPDWPPHPAIETEEEYRRLRFGLLEDELAESGWGVVFPAGIDGRVREALRPLIEHREEEARALFKPPDDLTLYPRETWEQFLERHNADRAEVDPERMPYYLLLVGDPKDIPFEFQWGLDYGYAVGRLDLPTPEAYRAYAEAVLAAERGEHRRSPKAMFFGVRNEGDRATARTTEDLIAPLACRIERNHVDWEVERILGAQATRSRLIEVLGGEETPALLFTASHGMVFEPGDPRQKEHQGALLCSDWSGPGHPVSREHYFAGEDLFEGADLRGTIAFHFACHSGGTPVWDSFPEPDAGDLRRRANEAFLSALPRALLGHPRGSALAVIGHVDRAWTSSFDWYRKGGRPTVFQSVLESLLGSKRIGFATESFATLCGGHAKDFAAQWAHRAMIPKEDLAELARAYRATSDARGFVVFGDPAVRLT